MQETIEEVRSQFGLQLPKINKKIDHQQKTNRKAIRFLLIRN
ncbi:hypothetical protein [Pseudanabaena sp. ABRG5-3]|nr:hypothetical protein [Pseudanabaena sp. ABRG5-3]